MSKMAKPLVMKSSIIDGFDSYHYRHHVLSVAMLTSVFELVSSTERSDHENE